MKICIKRDLSIEINGKDCLIEIDAEIIDDKIRIDNLEYIRDERVRLKWEEYIYQVKVLK